MRVEQVGLQSPFIANNKKTVEGAQGGTSFAKVLEDSLKETNRLQLEADNMDKLFAAGLVDNIADVTIASTKADIAISYTVEIISKVLNAYNEIMRLQL